MNFNQDRELDYLTTADPDEVVDILRITTQELLDMFPEKVAEYLWEDIEDVEDSEDADYDPVP